MCILQVFCGQAEEFPEAYRPVDSPNPNSSRNRWRNITLPPYSRTSRASNAGSARAFRERATQTSPEPFLSDSSLPPYPGSDLGFDEDETEIMDVHAVTTVDIQQDLELAGWVYDSSEFQIHDLGMRYYDMQIDVGKIFSLKGDFGNPRAMLVGTRQSGWFLIRRNIHYNIEKGWGAPLETVVFLGTSDREMLRRVRELMGQRSPEVHRGEPF